VNGCWDLFGNSIRNFVEEPIRVADDTCATCRNYRRADEAWSSIRNISPDHVYSSHYVAGFKAGFVDYIDSGGSGDPPAVPPFCYRLSCYQTPKGIRDVQDWYAGFRHGAAMGHASGYRETILVQLSALPHAVVQVSPPLAPSNPVPPAVPRSPYSPVEGEEVLPVPRKNVPPS
jgi:hypothetical protein